MIDHLVSYFTVFADPDESSQIKSTQNSSIRDHQLCRELEITREYWKLLQITRDYQRLLGITRDCFNLLEITRDYTRIGCDIQLALTWPSSGRVCTDNILCLNMFSTPRMQQTVVRKGKSGKPCSQDSTCMPAKCKPCSQ